MLSLPSTSTTTTSSTTSISKIHSHSTTYTTISKPNNEVAQPIYNVEVQYFQTTPLDLNGIHLSSRRILQKRDSLDIIEGPHPEEEYSNENTKGSWATFDEEQTSKSKIEKAPSWLPSNPPCIQENNQQKEEDCNFVEEEDIQNDPNKKVD